MGSGFVFFFKKNHRSKVFFAVGMVDGFAGFVAQMTRRVTFLEHSKRNRRKLLDDFAATDSSQRRRGSDFEAA